MADKKEFLMTIYSGMESSLVKQSEALPKGLNTKRFLLVMNFAIFQSADC